MQKSGPCGPPAIINVLKLPKNTEEGWGGGRYGSDEWQKDGMGGGGRSKGLTVSGGCFNELISKLWRIKRGGEKKNARLCFGAPIIYQSVQY